MDVTRDGSKVQRCKEQYCTGTWNVRSMNQDKLEVVKQDMERVNIDTLGISELKWTGMGTFNSDDHSFQRSSYYLMFQGPSYKSEYQHKPLVRPQAVLTDRT